MFRLDIATCTATIGGDEALWHHCAEQFAAGLATGKVADDLCVFRSQLTAERDSAAGLATLKKINATVAETLGTGAEAFCLAAFGWILPEAVALHQRLGATPEQIAATFHDTLRWANWHQRETGRRGIAELHWAVLPYAGQLFEIGCLQYQPRTNHLCVQGFAVSGRLLLFAANGTTADQNGQACTPETAAFTAHFSQENGIATGYLIGPATGSIAKTATSLPTEGFRQVISPDAPVIALHIPAKADLNPAAVDESLRRARNFFAGCGVAAEVCICYSWMLNPQLKQFFAPSSRVLMLASRFARISVPGEGSIDRFVFGTDRPLAEITPEECRTSLQQKIYAHRTAGNILPDFGGVMLL